MHKLSIGTLLALVLLATPRQAAEAGLIGTASVEDVVAASSHIVLARFDPKTYRLTAETWYRGHWEEGPLPIVEPPPILGRYMSRGRLKIRKHWHSKIQVDEPLDRVVLFLEEHLGRLHPTGYRRRGPGFGAHASLRLVSKQGQVFLYKQMMNPGKPMPVPTKYKDYPGFEVALKNLIKKHPYEPSLDPVKLPPIPVKERDRLLKLIDGKLNLYQGDRHVDYGGWYGYAPDRAGIEQLAKQLNTFVQETKSKGAQLYALDALMLLSAKAHGSSDHRPAVRAEAIRAVKHVDPALARIWVLDEIQHGPYGTDFAGLGRLAKVLGEDTYEQAIELLEGWVERQNWNKGLGAYWALAELGLQVVADAAEARRELRLAKEAKAKEAAAKRAEGK